MLAEVLNTGNYDLRLSAFPPLVVAVLIVLLSVKPLFKEGVGRVSATLFALSIAASVWLFSRFMMSISSSEHVAFWWAKFTGLGVPFIPAAMYHFTAVFLRKYDDHKTVVRLGWAFAALSSVIIISTDAIVAGVRHFSWGYSARYAPWSPVFLVFFGVFIGLSFYMLWKEYPLTPPQSAQHSRVKSFMVAFCIGSLGAVDYLPVFGVPIYPFGYLAIFAALVILKKEVSQLVDITPRFAARGIIEIMNDALLVLDADGIIRLVNDSAAVMLGLPERDLCGLPVSLVFDYALFSNMSAAVREGGVRHREISYRRPSGEELFLSISLSVMTDRNGRLLAGVCVARDVTDLKKAELDLRKAYAELEERIRERTAELREANENLKKEIETRAAMEQEMLKVRKLESVSILAGGIAHDFNNLLQAIITDLQLAKMSSGNEDKLLERLRDAEEVSMQARELGFRLLTFAKGGNPLKRKARIADLVKESFSAALGGSNVVCDFDLPADLHQVEIDKGQMDQVFRNLAINAGEAMPEGGRVGVSACNVTLTAGERPPLEEGEYVLVSVRDYGSGIERENLTRVFDPYFTTKGMGSQKGLGLGLAVCHSVVTKHGGIITVESERGSGAVFHVYLPACLK